LSETKSRRSGGHRPISAVIILAFTFGCLAAAGMPIATAIVGLLTGLGLVGLLGHFVAIPDVAPTLATMIGLGVGIDYALFIVFRYRDELHGGASVGGAIARTMATSGSAVVFAGGTVVIALLSLLVARVPILGAMGYAAAIAVVVAVLTAVTMLPAMLAVLGPRIDALRLPGRRRPHETAGRGQRLGALGRPRDAPPVDRPGRVSPGARAADAPGPDADARPGGRRRHAGFHDAAPCLRPDLGGLRAGRQPARSWSPRSSARRPRRAPCTRASWPRPTG